METQRQVELRGTPVSRPLRQLLDRLYHRHRRESLTALSLSMLAAATEGVGLIVLLPLLALLGVGSAGALAWLGDSPLAVLAGSLPGTIAVFLGLLMLRQLIVYLHRIHVMRARLAFAQELRVELFDALARAKWQHFSAGSLHRQSQILTLDSHRAGDAAQHCFGLAAALFLAAVQIAVAAWISHWFTLVVVAIALGIALTLRSRLQRVNALGRRLTERSDAVFALTANFLPMLRTARMTGTTVELRERFRAENARINDTVGRYVRQHTASTVGIQLAAGVALSVCVVVWMRVFAVGAAHLSILVLIFVRLTPVFGQLHQLLQKISYDLPAVVNAMSNIRHWKMLAEDVDEAVAPVTPPVATIGLREVTAGYATDGPPVLERLSLTLPVAKMTALCGPTGAGKTTVADVLAGLMQPAVGCVTLDNVGLPHTRVAAWRALVGYVDQDAQLFAGSIDDNLRWGAGNIDARRLEAVLRASAVDEFLAGLAEGLQTPVGERGGGLSGGQRQRIALARELLRRPRLLILDEATSGLDAATEARVLEALRSLEPAMTILLISHRDSALDFADEVILLDAGRIVPAAAAPAAIAASRGPGRLSA